LALTGAGWTREKAYSHVQQAAKAVLATESSFLDELSKDEEVGAVLSRSQLVELLHIEPRYDMSDRILRRLGILEAE
jgi:adenylosuccinate lyase